MSRPRRTVINQSQTIKIGSIIKLNEGNTCQSMFPICLVKNEDENGDLFVEHYHLNNDKLTKLSNFKPGWIAPENAKLLKNGLEINNNAISLNENDAKFFGKQIQSTKKIQIKYIYDNLCNKFFDKINQKINKLTNRKVSKPEDNPFNFGDIICFPTLISKCPDDYWSIGGNEYILLDTFEIYKCIGLDFDKKTKYNKLFTVYMNDKDTPTNNLDEPNLVNNRNDFIKSIVNDCVNVYNNDDNYVKNILYINCLTLIRNIKSGELKYVVCIGEIILDSDGVVDECNNVERCLGGSRWNKHISGKKPMTKKERYHNNYIQQHITTVHELNLKDIVNVYE